MGLRAWEYIGGGVFTLKNREVQGHWILRLDTVTSRCDGWNCSHSQPWRKLAWGQHRHIKDDTAEKWKKKTKKPLGLWWCYQARMNQSPLKLLGYMWDNNFSLFFKFWLQFSVTCSQKHSNCGQVWIISSFCLNINKWSYDLGDEGWQQNMLLNLLEKRIVQR